jgi:hypothetical protein
MTEQSTASRGVLWQVASTALAAAIVVNGTAKTATLGFGGVRHSQIFSAEVLREAGWERLRNIQQAISIGSSVAALLELVIGALILLNFWRRSALKAMGVLLILFSAFLLVMSVVGVPIKGCRCFSWFDPPPYIHFIMNGVLLLLIGALLRAEERPAGSPAT